MYSLFQAEVCTEEFKAVFTVRITAVCFMKVTDQIRSAIKWLLTSTDGKDSNCHTAGVRVHRESPA